MQDVLQDHDFVRLVREEITPQHTVYRIEVEGEGTLYSFDSQHTAVQYLNMLLHPLDVQRSRRDRIVSSEPLRAMPRIVA
ncbi:hypothetical protein EB809_20335 [Marinobacter sp. R17]|uniref:hypothetical protein n=1 Tax=Marinobacter TaxID=2742 RepID=UPI000F4C61C9|nr:MULTISPECIES: hypothetical protein [Marinobacter]ROT93659.1 hypothetical protein EB809_20335 [Marinobacter sp. R17]